MRSLKEIKEASNTIKELEADVDDRRRLQFQMVGQLYPSVMESEIQEIYSLMQEVRNASRKD